MCSVLYIKFQSGFVLLGLKMFNILTKDFVNIHKHQIKKNPVKVDVT